MDRHTLFSMDFVELEWSVFRIGSTKRTVLWVFTETGFHRNGFSPNALRAGFHRMPFRYGVSPNFYSINMVHSVKPRPYGFSPNALKVWVFTEYP